MPRLRSVIPLVLLAGCGHPATVEECEEIVARIAELEIAERGTVPEGERAGEIERLKKSVRESTMKECVGNRITDGAMECVRTAKQSKDVIRCFD